MNAITAQFTMQIAHTTKKAVALLEAAKDISDPLLPLLPLLRLRGSGMNLSVAAFDVVTKATSLHFGPDPLPGMYATPIFAVPKPHSEKLRMVNHMSAGKFAPNTMMDRFPMDTSRWR